VFIRNNGPKEILWVRQRELWASDLARHPQWFPVAIHAGSLVHDMPARDLVVSPSHRVLMSGERVSLNFGETHGHLEKLHLNRSRCRFV
jgi:hypothetical protein